MRLLAIETSTEACSVAVMVGEEVIERFELAPRRHAELVLPWAEALLAEAGLRRNRLDAVAVGRGPGAFTGVRLGISIAQGIALGLDLPLLPVSTLAVLAHGGLRGGGGHPVIAAIDARMGEVYWGAFACVSDGDGSAKGLRALGAEAVARPEAVAPPAGVAPPAATASPAAAELPAEGVELPTEGVRRAPGGPWHGVGTGFAAADGALVRHLGTRLASFDAAALPRAADLARLAVRLHAAGGAIAPERVEPAYLRDSVALNLAGQAAARESQRR